MSGVLGLMGVIKEMEKLRKLNIEHDGNIDFLKFYKFIPHSVQELCLSWSQANMYLSYPLMTG